MWGEIRHDLQVRFAENKSIVGGDVGGIFKFDAPGSYPDTWCGCAQPRPGACLRRGRRETGVQRMLGSIRSPRKANQRVGRDGRSGGVRLGRRSPLARLDGPTPGRNPRAEREGSGTRGVRDGREGSMTGGCRVVSVSDRRRAAMFEPRGPRANRGVALFPRQDRGLSRFGGRVGART